jgi:hypothetical protein
MTHKETDMLSDDQIEHGAASSHDMAWKDRVTAAEVWVDLLEGVTHHYSEHDIDRSELEEVGPDVDALIAKISEATDLTKETVEGHIRGIAKSLLSES